MTLASIRIALFALLLAGNAAAELRCEDPAFRQDEATEALTAQDYFRPGELVFFDCRVAGYKTVEQEEVVRLRLNWSAKATDAAGVLLAAPADGKIASELAAQDQEYRPRVRFRFELPVLIRGGAYRVEVTVKDELAETEQKITREFRVRAPEFAVTGDLALREVEFLRGENPIREGVFRPGEVAAARFHIVGFKVGEGNRVAVSYSISVQSPLEKVRLDDGSVTKFDQNSFYPIAYVPANFGVQLTPDSPRGTYVVTLRLRDDVAQVDRREMFTFRVE